MKTNETTVLHLCVNGYVDYWRVSLHRTRGLLYARRIGPTGRTFKRAFSVDDSRVIRLPGNLTHAEARQAVAALNPAQP